MKKKMDSKKEEAGIAKAKIQEAGVAKAKADVARRWIQRVAKLEHRKSLLASKAVLPKAPPKQHVSRGSTSVAKLASAAVPKSAPKPATTQQTTHKSHTVVKMAHERHRQARSEPAHKQAEQSAASLTKTPLKPPVQDDSNSVESLANIVKAAVETEEPGMTRASVVQSQPPSLPSKGVDSGATEGEALATGVLSIADSAVEDADVLTPPLQLVPQKKVAVKMITQAMPKPLQKKLQVDPKVVAVQSEMAETAKQVARFEEDLAPAAPVAPVPESPAETLRRLDPSIAAQAKQKEDRDTNVAAIALSEALSEDLDGVLPNIDHQASQLYNTFGGEPASAESLGSEVSSSPAFLQVIRHKMPLRLNQFEQHMRLAQVAQADLNAAYHSLEEIADDAKGAMSMMDELRNTVKSPHVDDRCKILMQKFEHRQLARAKREAELDKRSQELQRLLHPSSSKTHLHLKKTKHLRKH